MAPNITGNSTLDAQIYSRLYAAIFFICGKIFEDAGSLVFKFFQTDTTAVLRRIAHLLFESSLMRKPNSSRSRSREACIVARGCKPHRVAKLCRFNDENATSCVH